MSENSENVFVSFDARGVHWSTCIGKADLPEFYTAMGVEVFCRLAVEPLALAGDPTSHLLEQKVV